MSKIIRIFLIYFSSNNFSFNEFLSKIYSQMTLVFKIPLLRIMVNSSKFFGLYKARNLKFFNFFLF